jgi:transposase
MIQITAQMRVLVAIEPVDGRKGIDSLARLCQDKLAEDPFSGCVFVFRSRSGTAIRLLSYDGQGYWLAQKRLSKGGLCGGRKTPERPSHWKPMRHSC